MGIYSESIGGNYIRKSRGPDHFLIENFLIIAPAPVGYAETSVVISPSHHLPIARQPCQTLYRSTRAVYGYILGLGALDSPAIVTTAAVLVQGVQQKTKIGQVTFGQLTQSACTFPPASL
jgi:hypothetical protein